MVVEPNPPPHPTCVDKEEAVEDGKRHCGASGIRFQPGFRLMAAAGQTYPSEDALLPAGLPTHGGSAEKLSPSAVNRLLMELLMYFGRAAFLLYPVYLSGYLGFSVSWVLLCMVMVTWWKKNRQWKDSRIGTAIEFVDNESQVVHKELRSALQMASWVCTEPLFGVGVCECELGQKLKFCCLAPGNAGSTAIRLLMKYVGPVSCMIITNADISAAAKAQASHRVTMTTVILAPRDRLRADLPYFRVPR